MALSTSQLAALTAALDKAMQVNYRDFQAGQVNWATDLTNVRMVPKREVTLPFIQDAGFVRETEFHQPPKYETLLGERAIIKLQKFESAIRLSVYDAAEDDTGQQLEEAQQIGMNYAFLNRDLVAKRLREGDSSSVLMYDGENYFANAHPKGGTTYDNLLAGALSSTTFQAARTAMRRFPSDGGTAQPLNIEGNRLIVPPDLEFTARQLMDNTKDPNTNLNTENVLRGMAQVISDARFTDADDWYLIAVTAPQKPFLHLKMSGFSPMKLHAETAEDSPAVRDHSEFRWWGRTVETVFPTHPYLAIKVVN